MSSLTRIIAVAASLIVGVTSAAHAQQQNPSEYVKILEPGYIVDVVGRLNEKPPLLCFGVTISDGIDGFEPGIFITSGPLADRTKLFFMKPSGEVETFLDGLVSNESAVFAKGVYGTGLFVSQIKNGQVIRVMPDRSWTVFAREGLTAASADNTLFGPAQLFYGPDVFGEYAQALYVTDFSDGSLKRLSASGEVQKIAQLVPYTYGPTKFAAPKGGASAAGVIQPLQGGADMPFVITTWNSFRTPNTGSFFTLHLGAGLAYSNMSWDRRDMDGIQLITTSSDNDFGNFVYMPTDGGRILRMNGAGEISTFAENIFSAQVAFDRNKTLGGGMVSCERGENDEANYVVIVRRGK